MTLRARLAIGIFTIGVLLLVPLLLATRSLEEVGERTRALRTSDFMATTVLGQMRAATDDFRQAELALGVDPQPAMRYENVVSALTRLDGLVESLPRVGLTEHAPAADSLVGRMRSLAGQELQALVSRRTRQAEDIADSLPPVEARLERLVRTMETQVSRRTEARVDTSASIITRAQRQTALAFALAAAAAAAIAALLTWTISRPVAELSLGMARVADGEFDHALRIDESRDDEFGRLARSYTTMTRQLAALDKLKAEVVSIASHELKTPINVILGYVQLLREGVYGGVPEKQRDVLDTIDAQGRTLSRLVRQLLDISRFEAGVTRLDPRQIALRNFLHDLERAFDVLARQRGAEFTVEAHAGVPTHVVWDADRMNEVLGNLLANAFKFTTRGGRVTLAVSATDDRVVLEVGDTGAGIAAEQLPRIFDKFYQADNQASAAAKGTGLGLAIAKSIVEAHGGTIACDSTPGVGTTFTIEMPTRTSARRGAGVVPAVPPAAPPAAPASPVAVAGAVD